MKKTKSKKAFSRFMKAVEVIRTDIDGSESLLKKSRNRLTGKEANKLLNVGYRLIENEFWPYWPNWKYSPDGEYTFTKYIMTDEWGYDEVVGFCNRLNPKPAPRSPRNHSVLEKRAIIENIQI